MTLARAAPAALARAAPAALVSSRDARTALVDYAIAFSGGGTSRTTMTAAHPSPTRRPSFHQCSTTYSGVLKSFAAVNNAADWAVRTATSARWLDHWSHAVLSSVLGAPRDRFCPVLVLVLHLTSLFAYHCSVERLNIILLYVSLPGPARVTNGCCLFAVKTSS